MTPVLLHLPPSSPWHMYLPVVGGPCPPVGQKPAVLQTESWLGLLTYLVSLPVYITWVIVTWDNYTQLSSLTGVLRSHCLPILQMSTPSGKWWPPAVSKSPTYAAWGHLAICLLLGNDNYKVIIQLSHQSLVFFFFSQIFISKFFTIIDFMYHLDNFIVHLNMISDIILYILQGFLTI